jgi:hypothetical protein
VRLALQLVHAQFQIDSTKWFILSVLRRDQLEEAHINEILPVFQRPIFVVMVVGNSVEG